MSFRSRASLAGTSFCSTHLRTICRTILCSSLKANIVVSLHRHDPVLAPGPLDAAVPRHLDGEAEELASVAGVDDVVDHPPARRLVDVDVPLDHLGELGLDLGRRLGVAEHLAAGDP